MKAETIMAVYSVVVAERALAVAAHQARAGCRPTATKMSP
jgi:hypothetical protein